MDRVRVGAYVRLLPVLGLPEVEPGDDLAGLLATYADLADGDVVVVAQKIVSKAEGRLVEVEPGEDVAQARRRLARAEARRVVVDTPWVLITETPQGFVCANGGVDASNVTDGTLVLLPADPDASARRLRAGLRAADGVRVGVVIADTFGRPWRRGQTDVAIGVAGLEPVRDERGGDDRFGNPLAVTEAAVADELAAAADLVRRKADGIPAVVVRGLDVVTADDGPGAAAIVRPAGEDLFRRGAGGLADALIVDDAPRDASGPAPGWVLERAAEAARRVSSARVRDLTDPPRFAVVGGPLEAGVAAGVLVAVLVDGGLRAGHRLPRPDEQATIVVEWDASGHRR